MKESIREIGLARELSTDLERRLLGSLDDNAVAGCNCGAAISISVRELSVESRAKNSKARDLTLSTTTSGHPRSTLRHRNGNDEDSIM